jgi:glycosyltransferase involved in cell wall biosynthesis
MEPLVEPEFKPPWRPLEPAGHASGCRVLVLSHMFPHPDQPGLGSFVAEQAAALRVHEGIVVRVLSGRPFSLLSRRPLAMWRKARGYRGLLRSCRWWEYEGVPIRYVPYRVFARTWSHGWMYRAAMLDVIDEVRDAFPFDLVHAHTGYLDGLAGLAIARRFDVPLVITEHTNPLTLLTRNPLIRQLTRTAYHGAQRVIAVSRSLQREVAAEMRSGRRDRAIVLPNGVDTELFHPACESERPAGRSESPRLLFVGYFAPYKNLPLLLEAFARVLRRLPGATLQMVGGARTAADEAELRQHIERLGIGGHLALRGFCTRDEIARLMREACDVFVLSSRSETFGCVLAEALACGRPVVSTRCGGPEDIVTDAGLGELCPPGDPDALAAAILKVAARLDDYDPAAIRAEAVARFSWPAVAARIAAEYQAIAPLESCSAREVCHR